MAEKISVWAEGIIIAIIIGAILQIILPENKNKKYIKVIIGIYILFCIISPVIGNTINIQDFNIDKYLEINTISSNTESSFEDNVKNVFQEKMKYAIKKHLNEKGYDTNNIEVVTDSEYSVRSVKIGDIIEYGKDNNLVNRVEINIKEKPVTGMAIGAKYELKKYIAETYNMDEKDVIIE